MFNRITLILPVILGLLISSCNKPPAPSSFQADIKPIIDQHCLECHQKGGAGTEASGFNVTTYDSIMKGTKFGPVVIPGDALSSNLYRMVAGEVDPSIRMPHGRDPLPDNAIALIEHWIEEGARRN